MKGVVVELVKLTRRKNDIAHWGINPSQKHHYSSFLPTPLKSAHCSSPHFRQFPSHIWPQSSHLLKVIKFIVKISQFKFLFMIYIFIYKRFVSLNIFFQILVYFLCKNCNTPSKKVTPSFPATLL